MFLSLSLSLPLCQCVRACVITCVRACPCACVCVFLRDVKLKRILYEISTNNISYSLKWPHKIYTNTDTHVWTQLPPPTHTHTQTHTRTQTHYKLTRQLCFFLCTTCVCVSVCFLYTVGYISHPFFREVQIKTADTLTIFIRNSIYLILEPDYD